MPKVSVVVPVYKVENYLEQCVNSILEQTLLDIEIVLIDNGGTDRCPEICRYFERQDKRIKLISLKQNIGLRGAWLEGLTHVTSEYVTFVDSDDFIQNDFIEMLFNAISKHNVDCVSAGYRDYIEDRFNKTKRFEQSKIFFKQAIETEILTPFFEQTESIDKTFGNSRWAKIYKTDVLIKVAKSCNKEISSGEDIELNIKFLSNCQKVMVLENVDGYCYRSVRDGAISYRFDRVRLGRDELFYDEIQKISDEQNREGKALGTELLYNSSNILRRYLSQDTELFEKLECAKKIMDRVFFANKLDQTTKDRLSAMFVYPCLVGQVPKSTKLELISKIKNQLSDKKYLYTFSKTQPFKGRIVYLAVHFGLEKLLINILR